MFLKVYLKKQIFQGFKIVSILCNQFYKRHFRHEFYVRHERSECLINECLEKFIIRSCFGPLWKNESIQYNKLRLNVVFNFVSICKVTKINVKYVTCASAKRDDQNSAKLRVCFIRVYVFAFAATFNTVLCFFLANQTSFKDEFFPTAFFIDDKFFV
jgi:hypothetical protein